MGTGTSDDAAVWRLDADRALVVTADFITPIVDDARAWGRIAAANAVSDVYAMGGRPLLGLNLVGWNTEELGTDILLEVLQGAGEMAKEGGWITVGGHTVDDPEPKFGMAMVGEVHPDRILTNAALRPGDALVLTKALGVGVIATAMKAGKAPDEVMEAAVASMTRLNREAAAEALAAGATGATDVTGFGLLGHLHEMLEASGVGAEIDAAAVPLLLGTLALAEDGVVPGGTKRNHRFLEPFVDWGALPEAEQLVLADAQTSGGLLIASSEGERLEEALADRGVGWARVGETRPGNPGMIAIRGRISG